MEKYIKSPFKFNFKDIKIKESYKEIADILNKIFLYLIIF